jgi:hypothetical protein
MDDPQKFLNDLKRWCDQQYGRKSKVARMLELSPQLVNDWFTGKSTPTWQTGLQIQSFLAKSEKGRRQAIGEKA